MAQPDLLRALAGGGQEHLRCGAVAVLLQEVMFHLPHVVVAEPVGQLDLVQGVLQEAVFVAVRPGAGQLVLVEDSELHRTRP